MQFNNRLKETHMFSFHCEKRNAVKFKTIKPNYTKYSCVPDTGPSDGELYIYHICPGCPPMPGED